ncbi:hypothetical protein EIN_371350 [Entamoeba invadens IP1]|uniref:Transmembrane protein n=1 Tax=Entamoeba invadens IP1 TaxID=370355 RepID=A0A0A1UC64_ENTIV|nr:hypothetical protein EIN_371350 [Entamoeba invadens IP1]ELP92723.1 hypothetical protein EIN_371350 [Entamoeba invadens IP1]|eukprot:XP_004259494.1 hypothetical protein EIN_371350 [Entamoeba invadens IP1]
MKYFLYTYEDETPQANDTDGGSKRIEYFKKQYRVKFYLKAILIFSIILTVILAVVRAVFTKWSYTCDNKYATLFTRAFDPPFIKINTSTYFYTFVEPAIPLIFGGVFVKTKYGLISKNTEFPSVTLNTSKYTVEAKFGGCEESSFIQHYIECDAMTLTFGLNKNYNDPSQESSDEIVEDIVLVTVKDPDPVYSMYVKHHDTGCVSSFNIVVIPLYKQSVYPARTDPQIICGDINNYFNFTVEKNNAKQTQNFSPFIQQIANTTEQNIRYTIEPKIYRARFKEKSHELNFTNPEPIVLTQKSRDIPIYSHDSLVGVVSLYDSAKVTKSVRFPNDMYNFFGIDFHPSFSVEGFIITSVFFNEIKNVSCHFISSNDSVTTIQIKAKFYFFNGKMPAFLINNSTTSISNLNSKIVDNSQFFNYENAFVEADMFEVEIKADMQGVENIESLKIEIPNCDGCNFEGKCTNGECLPNK